MEKIRNRIREEREARSMTLTQLSEASGISKSTLSRYEHGGDAPTSALQKVAEVMDIPTTQLLVESKESEDGTVLGSDILAQLAATQQKLLFCLYCYDISRAKQRFYHAIILMLCAVLVYILVDRFCFPDGLLFRD